MSQRASSTSRTHFKIACSRAVGRKSTDVAHLPSIRYANSGRAKALRATRWAVLGLTVNLLAAGCVAQEFSATPDGRQDMTVYQANRACAYTMTEVTRRATANGLGAGGGLLNGIAASAEAQQTPEWQWSQRLYDSCMMMHGWQRNQ